MPEPSSKLFSLSCGIIRRNHTLWMRIGCNNQIKFLLSHIIPIRDWRLIFSCLLLSCLRSISINLHFETVVSLSISLSLRCQFFWSNTNTNRYRISLILSAFYTNKSWFLKNHLYFWTHFLSFFSDSAQTEFITLADQSNHIHTHTIFSDNNIFIYFLWP